MKFNQIAKNILIGMGSVLNIFPAPPSNPTANKSDLERLRSDWERVGSDFYQAIRGMENGKHNNR
jgi:hypothetical protein